MRTLKNIDQDLEKLLRIKEEVDKINEFKKLNSSVEVVSQRRYDFLVEKNIIKADTFYYITTIEVGQYVEGFQG